MPDEVRLQGVGGLEVGRRYAVDLGFLSETFRWSMNADIEPLAQALSFASGSNLVAVGSGGSHTAAHFAASLHQRYTGKLSKPVTPLEFAADSLGASEPAILILSATGRNPDILGAFRRAIGCEPKRLIVICFQPESPLVQRAGAYRYVDTFALHIPSGKDGFLATNSLLATAVLLYRAYAKSFSFDTCLPKNYLDLLCVSGDSPQQFFSSIRARSASLWERDTILVLHGPSTGPAAVDFESKFVEAALGNVQVSDYRNFAHGRHHWLAKRPLTSGIVAFISDDDRKIAEKTLALIPRDVLTVRFDLGHGGERACLAALLYVLHLVALAGGARGIDPGVPGVPSFGRRIFRMSSPRTVARPETAATAAGSCAIARKMRAYGEWVHDKSELRFWERQYFGFCQKLARDVFAALVVDYDGTLCDERDRFCGIDEGIVTELTRLLRARILVGIATGRGKSVRDDLRKKLSPAHWNKVVIGYYNGAERAFLTDDSHPNSSPVLSKALLPLRETLESDRALNAITKHTYRRMQITIEPKQPNLVTTIWLAIQQHVEKTPSKGALVLRSKHSVDILAPGVSKTLLVNDIEQLLPTSSSKAILCIGDLGRWPGNDHQLLSHPHSLSVDEVSCDPKTCWNLAPPGHRGVQATLDYLKGIRVADGSFKIAVKLIEKAIP